MPVHTSSDLSLLMTMNIALVTSTKCDELIQSRAPLGGEVDDDADDEYEDDGQADQQQAILDDSATRTTGRQAH